MYLLQVTLTIYIETKQTFDDFFTCVLSNNFYPKWHYPQCSEKICVF